MDLTDDSPRIVARAQALAASTKAKLMLMHVVEYIPVDPAGEALLPPPIEVERDLVALFLLLMILGIAWHGATLREK